MNRVSEFPSSVGTRPSWMMANACSARLQCGTGNFFAALHKARYKDLNAALSFGNDARVLMTLRGLMLKDSIVFVVETARRMSSGSPNIGVIRAQLARHDMAN